MDEKDINEVPSSKDGLAGLIETTFRRFQNLGFILTASPIILLYTFCLGTSLTPGVLLFRWVETQTVSFHPIGQAFLQGATLAVGAILFIICLIFVVPLCNFLLPFRVKPFRGAWFSLQSIPWLYHNALTYLVRYTVLDLVTPSPLNLIFYRMMGMKVGKGTMINTSNISDPCLITLGNYVTIGGSATMMAHYGMKGYLIIDRTVVGDKTTLGLASKILGGVTIGQKVTVTPGTVVLPKTIIPDNTKYTGAQTE